MAALWIAHVTVTDAEAYGKYAELAGPAIAKHGGTFIARAARYVQLEGKERPRNVVARFPSRRWMAATPKPNFGNAFTRLVPGLWRIVVPQAGTAVRFSRIGRCTIALKAPIATPIHQTML